MDRRPADSDGLILPRVSPDAAWDAAAGLTAVARSTQAALDLLDSAPGDAICWSGPAADEYRAVRRRLAVRTAQVAELASAGAGVVLDWLREAAPALTAMRATAARLTDLQRQVQAASALAYDPVLDARLQADVDDGYRRWHAAQDAYWSAVYTAARRLTELRDLVTDRPVDTLDHVDGAFRSAWEGYVAGPATAGWALTGLAFTDRDRWWANVTGLPGGAVGTVTAIVDDPAAAGRAVVDWEDWSTGRYGAAATTLGVAFLPGPEWLGLGEDLGRIRFAANIADPRAPKPRLQTLDEMLDDGVDLDRHEHYEYGHTLRRHVDVDDDYLMDRITHGTLEDVDGRGHPMTTASRFTDRATAERVITQALTQHQQEVRWLIQHPEEEEIHIRYPAHEVIGQVMKKAPGGFSVDDGSVLALSVRIGPDGPYIHTAFVQ